MREHYKERVQRFTNDIHTLEQRYNLKLVPRFQARPEGAKVTLNDIEPYIYFAEILNSEEREEELIKEEIAREIEKMEEDN